DRCRVQFNPSGETMIVPALPTAMNWPSAYATARRSFAVGKGLRGVQTSKGSVCPSAVWQNSASDAANLSAFIQLAPWAFARGGAKQGRRANVSRSGGQRIHGSGLARPLEIRPLRGSRARWLYGNS